MAELSSYGDMLEQILVYNDLIFVRIGCLNFMT